MKNSLDAMVRAMDTCSHGDNHKDRWPIGNWSNRQTRSGVGRLQVPAMCMGLGAALQQTAPPMPEVPLDAMGRCALSCATGATPATAWH